MRLYHGGVDRIESPDCSRGRDNLDFGKGFYMTLLKEQAEEWARQVAFNRGRVEPMTGSLTPFACICMGRWKSLQPSNGYRSISPIIRYVFFLRKLQTSI